MSNRIIILEGPDGGGKTTLANRLRDQYNYQVWHTGKPEPWFKDEDLAYYYKLSLWRARTLGQSVVFDRHWLGELVYGPVMRNQCLLNEQHIRYFEMQMATLQIKLCVVMPPFEEVLKNWKLKHNDYIPDEQKLTQVFMAYEKLAERYWRYDYTTDDKDNTRFIREALC